MFHMGWNHQLDMIWENNPTVDSINALRKEYRSFEMDVNRGLFS